MLKLNFDFFVNHVSSVGQKTIANFPFTRANNSSFGILWKLQFCWSYDTQIYPSRLYCFSRSLFVYMSFLLNLKLESIKAPSEIPKHGDAKKFVFDTVSIWIFKMTEINYRYELRGFNELCSSFSSSCRLP